MVSTNHKFMIVTLRKPKTENVNVLLQWFGTSLGLFSLRDKDKSQFRIFIELLKAAKEEQPKSSDELANLLSLTRGTVIHHVNKLMSAGLVIHEGNRYMLRVESLTSLITELERDLLAACSDLQQVAKDIDGRLNLS